MSLTTIQPAPSKGCLVCAFAKSDLKNAYESVKRALTREEINYVAKHEYAMPDSNNCKKALELVTSCSPTHLTNHCLRSYAFAVGMAHKVKKNVDKEVLFLGCIMHDLGLTPTYDTGKTFEIDGAQAAHKFCLAHGLSDEKAELVHEMVAHHNSVGLAHKLDPEVALLHYGAGLDVAGLWIKDIHPNTLTEVIETFPRLDFKEGMQALLKGQMERKPESYMKPFLELGFLKKIEQAPF